MVTESDPPEELTPHSTGYLDIPVHGSEIEGDVLVVKGWSLFDGSRLSRVEIFIDGESVGLARPFLDRVDLATMFPHADAAISGFEAMVDLSSMDPAAEFVVSVEARSLDGRIWRSLPNRVRRRALALKFDRFRQSQLEERSRASLASVPNSRRRVVVFTHDLGYGGGQLWLSELLRQMTDFPDMEFTVVATADGPLREQLEILGIQVHVTGIWSLGNMEAYEGRIHELALLIRAHQAGAILVNTLGMFPAIEAAARAGVPSIWAIHESFQASIYTYINWGAKGILPEIRNRFRDCFSLPKGLVFEARQTADLFRDLSAAERRFVVDYGVDLDEIDSYRSVVDRDQLRADAGYTATDVVIAVVGTLEARKAQAAAVVAFEELAEVDDHLRLVLVGDHPCPYGEGIVAHLERSSVSDRVHLEPITPDVYKWYTIPDVLLCASDIESLPRTILEALAFELPVVSTNAFGIADLIDDRRTGWLTRPRDLEGLLGVLHGILRLSSDERRTVAARARGEVMRRHGAASYGRLFARALMELLKDEEADLGGVLTHAGEQRGGA